MSAYTEALHKLADFIDATDGLFGTEYTENDLSIDSGGSIGIHPKNFWDDKDGTEEKANTRAIVRAIGGTFEKDFSGSMLYLRRTDFLGYFDVTIYASRDGVCERKVVGTKTVEHARIEAVKGYTETVDVIEWECGTLLGDQAAVPAELVSA